MKSLDMAHPAVYVNQPHPEKIDLESRFYEGLTANKLNLAWLHLLGVTGKTTILRAAQKVFVIEKPGSQEGGEAGMKIINDLVGLLWLFYAAFFQTQFIGLNLHGPLDLSSLPGWNWSFLPLLYGDPVRKKRR